jgi:hypothetical protein
MRKNNLILIAVLLLIGFLACSPRINHRFPVHLDEWVHLNWATYVMDRENYMEKEPLFSEASLPKHEVGFHVLLSEIFLMSGIDPVLQFRHIPVLFNIVSALLLFIIIFKTTKNFYTGIFAMLFYASLRSNINILGTWFFVPFVFTFPLIFILFYTTAKAAENKRFLILSILTIFLLFFIHVQVAIFSSLVFIIYLILNYKKITKNKKYLFLMILVPLIILIFYTKALWNNNFIGFIQNIIHRLTFKGYGQGPAIDYNLLFFYGIIPSILAAIGAIFSLRDLKQRFWIIWIALAGIILIIFAKFELTFFVAYRRLIYIIMVGLVPLSALGLSALLKYLKKKVRKLKKIIPSVVIAFVFIAAFWNYYNIPANTKIFYLINDEEYDSLKWFEQNYGNYNLIFAPRWLSETVYPITKNYVDHNLVKLTDDKKDEFYQGNCTAKLNIARQVNASFVFSEKEINCSFLSQLHDDSIFIFKLR